jgi:hypothetical protein
MSLQTQPDTIQIREATTIKTKVLTSPTPRFFPFVVIGVFLIKCAGGATDSCRLLITAQQLLRLKR